MVLAFPSSWTRLDCDYWLLFWEFCCKGLDVAMYSGKGLGKTCACHSCMSVSCMWGYTLVLVHQILAWTSVVFCSFGACKPQLFFQSLCVGFILSSFNFVIINLEGKGHLLRQFICFEWYENCQFSLIDYRGSWLEARDSWRPRNVAGLLFCVFILHFSWISPVS